MSDTLEELDLDQVTTIPVKIGNQSFTITQQSRPQLQRILTYVNDEVTDKLKEKKEDTPLTELLFDNFYNQLPAIALIFGNDPKTPEGKKVVAHLNDHLRPDGAIKVFERWWELNHVDDFFDRGGRPLMHPEMVEVARRAKQKAVEETLN